MLGCRELERRERRRAPEDVEDADREQERAHDGERVLGRQHQLERAEAGGAAEDEEQPRATDRREDQRTAQGAGAEHRGDQPEDLGPLVEGPAREEGQQHVEVERERAHEEDGEERDRHASRPEGEAEGLGDPGEDGRARACPARPGGDPHRGDRADHDRVAHGVRRERDARAGGRDDDAAERRSDDSRRRSEPRAEADRVRQVVPADDPEDERVARGRVECERDALDEAEGVQLPCLDHVGERQHRQHRGDQHEHGLAGDHHPPEVDAVGDRAPDECERRHGQRLDECERPDGNRGSVSSRTSQ